MGKNILRDIRLPSLRTFKSTNQSLDSKLREVAKRIAVKPELVKRFSDDTFTIFCNPPANYKCKMLHRRPQQLSMRITLDGTIVEICEVDGNVSGGWMASCIPSNMYRVFLSAWLEQNNEKQLELF